MFLPTIFISIATRCCSGMSIQKSGQPAALLTRLLFRLIAVSAARNPQWSVGITVSRRILFYSAALFGAAAYLLAMAAAGYYLRFFGGSWGTVMQVSFLFGAVVLLLAVLFSGTLRSWLRVFISKHFFSYNYDYREEWLHFTRTLSESGHGLGERVIQALAQLVESPGGSALDSAGFRKLRACHSLEYALGDWDWSRSQAPSASFWSTRSG